MADQPASPPARRRRPPRPVLPHQQGPRAYGQPIAAALLVLLAIVLAFHAYAGFNGWDSLGRGLAMLAVGAAVVVAVLHKLRSPRIAGGQYIQVQAHAHDDDAAEGEDLRRVIARHEGGHATVIEDNGGKVKSARVFPGTRGGIVQARLPEGSLEEVVTAGVAFLIGGRRAAGTDMGSSRDMASEEQLLRELPRQDRDRVRNAAEQMATTSLARHQPKLRKYEDRLYRKGRL